MNVDEGKRPGGSPPYFELADLRFAYDRRPGAADLIQGISLSIRAGEMAGLIGPNGAGKSTLLHLMSGLLKPSSGHARIQGTEAAGMEPLDRARRAAFVPQASRVGFPYTVGEIIAMGRHPHLGSFGDLTPRDKERVAWAMEATGTAPFARRPFNRLSGGEAQRVVVARALAQDAPAILLDEPTASLDLHYQTALYGLLERLNHERGLTVLIVTHDINLAAEYCPRLIGIRQGRILMDAPPEEIVTPERIMELYGVQAEILSGGGGRMVRVRHLESKENGG